MKHLVILALGVILVCCAGPESGEPDKAVVFDSVVEVADEAVRKSHFEFTPHGYNFIDPYDETGRLVWIHRTVIDGRLVSCEKAFRNFEELEEEFTLHPQDRRASVEVHNPVVRNKSKYDRIEQLIRVIRDLGFSSAAGVSN